MLKTLKDTFDCDDIKINESNLQEEFRLVLDSEFTETMAD